MAASTSPIVLLPTSPMKIDPLGKFQGRKPALAPASATSSAAADGSPCRMASTANVPAAITACAAAMPLMPSMKLYALVTPTIQMTVTAAPSHHTPGPDADSIGE